MNPRPALAASRRQLLQSLLALAGARLLAGCASSPPTSDPAGNAGLPPHPRLIARPQDWAALAARRGSDPELDGFISQLLQRAHTDLTREPVERRLEGHRLLHVSREFIRRVLLWCLAWRLGGGEAHLERARREMLAVCAFPDWHPDHYLDVAEMTTGMALAYDWLFEALSAADRTTIRRAIVAKGIAQARHGHKTFAMQNNWGQVCIGGMVLGALAVAEDEPALAQDLLAAARRDAFIALDAYRPDGVYAEGPNYWNFGTIYEVLLIAALRSATGEDWDLPAAPGFARSAEFMTHVVGPTGKRFNFADSGEGQELAPPLFWLARELRQPVLIDGRRAMIRARQGLSERFAPLAALWWPDRAGDAALPLHFSGQGPQPVAIWRSAWSNPDALWFAIKGGGAHHSHAHMDGGSFVLDLGGVRWAKDPGMQDYNSLESRGIDLWNRKQDSSRWRVWRIGAEAHNTLTVNGYLHDADGMAVLRHADTNAAKLDLTPLFLPGQLQRATRQARIGTTGITLLDTVEGLGQGLELRWAMTTDADIILTGNEARLSSAGKTLRLRFAGSPVRLEVLDVSTPRHDYDQPNPATRQLIARGPASRDGHWQLEVSFARG